MGFVTDVRRWFVDDLYREPRGGKWFWLMVGLGVLTAAYGAVGVVVENVGAHFVLLGGAFVAMGAAELVPQDRIEAARNLRIGTWVAFVLYAAWVFGPPFLAASPRTKLVAIVALLFSVVFSVLIYKILNN